MVFLMVPHGGLVSRIRGQGIWGKLDSQLVLQQETNDDGRGMTL